MQSTELIMSKSVLVELLRFLVDMAVPRLLVKSVVSLSGSRLLKRLQDHSLKSVDLDFE